MSGTMLWLLMRDLERGRYATAEALGTLLGYLPWLAESRELRDLSPVGEDLWEFVVLLIAIGQVAEKFAEATGDSDALLRMVDPDCVELLTQLEEWLEWAWPDPPDWPQDSQMRAMLPIFGWGDSTGIARAADGAASWSPFTAVPRLSRCDHPAQLIRQTLWRLGVSADAEALEVSVDELARKFGLAPDDLLHLQSYLCLPTAARGTLLVALAERFGVRPMFPFGHRIARRGGAAIVLEPSEADWLDHGFEDESPFFQTLARDPHASYHLVLSEVERNYRHL